MKAKQLGRAVGAGAGVGLALFAAESLLILRSGAAGFSMDTEGPFRALAQAVAAQLPGLIGRVAAVYLSAGALFGIIAGLLTLVVCPQTKWRTRLVFLAELGLLVVLLCYHRAVQRPALFDDIAALRPMLALCMTYGELWHAWVVLALVVVGHGTLAVRRGVFPRRVLIAVPLVAVAAGAVGLAGVAARPAAGRGPFVLLVGIDAFRPDRLAALGSKRVIAPTLDAFVTESTLFTRAYTPIAQTEPAWRALLTASWPPTNGSRYPLTAESRWASLPTFTQRLDEAGVATHFFTDCSRFNYQTPRSGFRHARQPPRGAINFVLEKLRFRGVGLFADNVVGAAWLPELVDNRALAGIHNPMAYAERLADDLVDIGESGPAFAAFHATAAHFPGDAVFPFYRRFVSASEPLERRARMHFSPLLPGSSGGWTREGSEALYDELLAQADAQLAILFARLKARGLYDDATIIVFSDHGESFHEDAPMLAGGTPVHGARLRDEENRILLAMKLPRSHPAYGGRRVDDVVRLIDIGPTILDVLKVAALNGADGESLLPLVSGARDVRRKLYAETGFTHARPDVFDPRHHASAPRSLDAYEVGTDGVVSVSQAAHCAVLEEKDVGAYDGERWIVRRPLRGGGMETECIGACPAPELEDWLDQVLVRRPDESCRRTTSVY